MKPGRFLALASACFALAVPGRAATAADSLAENHAKWKANRPARYAYVYRNVCFCPSTPLRIEVRGDSVIGVSPNLESDDSTQSASNDQDYSPDSLFARIGAELARQPARAQITYHEQLGLPLDAYFDPSPLIADDEHGFGISRFMDRSGTSLARPPASRVTRSRERDRDLAGRALSRTSVTATVFRLSR